ncbi:hypothetical protein D3C76_964740 [compost metagenome]
MSGSTPVVLAIPSVPRKLFKLAPVVGAYRDTPVCDPIAAAAKSAATDTADPPLEPKDVFDG